MDELNKPLGLDRNPASSNGTIAWARPVIGFCALVLGVTGLWVWVSEDPLGGEPVTTLDLTAKTTSQSSQNNNEDLRARLNTKPRTYTTSNPRKPARLDPLPRPTPNNLTEIGSNQSGTVQSTIGLSHRPEKELVEKTPYGWLPVRSGDGRTAFSAYSRPVESFGTTRIAIVVGGLGLSQTGTLSAIENLPSEITLGFAAYGNSLRRWMEVARKDGHELVLQLPMEPTNYPAVNPGKQTLLTSASADQNINNLHWFLGRLTNYAAVMNYLGSAMALNTDALAPVLQEIHDRGLAYLDDGSVPHGKSREIANKLQMPFAQSHMIIDEDRSAKMIDRRLRALEKLARQNGYAIAVASAFPVSVERIARWTEAARKRGLEIVPLSALINDPSRGN